MIYKIIKRIEKAIVLYLNEKLNQYEEIGNRNYYKRKIH